LDVSGATTLKSRLDVRSDVSMNANVDISGNLDVCGNIVVGNVIITNNTITINGTNITTTSGGTSSSNSDDKIRGFISDVSKNVDILKDTYGTNINIQRNEGDVIYDASENTFYGAERNSNNELSFQPLGYSFFKKNLEGQPPSSFFFFF